MLEEGNVNANEPGNFRRHFIRHNHGEVDPDVGTTSFLDFLDLYGSFAGEDLAETEDESSVADEEDERARERAPLLLRHKSSRPRQMCAGDA